MKRSIQGFAIAVMCLIFGATGAWAQTSYPSALAADFTNWCTTKQGQPATVCSCALDRAVQQIPAVTLASYLAAPAGTAAATVSSGVGLTAVQIVTACASGASPATGAAVGAAVGAASTLGSGLFGK